MARWAGVWLIAACALAPPASAAALSGREVRCLALVAYTEAAVDGIPGMTAVIRVVRNRMADPRFPDDACAVIAQVAQFQPIAQSEVLQKVAADPEGYSIPQVLGLRSPQARRLLATAHRLARAAPAGGWGPGARRGRAGCGRPRPVGGGRRPPLPTRPAGRSTSLTRTT